MTPETVKVPRSPKPRIANTWPEFLACVRESTKELGNPSTVWYRGMARSEYKLIPSLLRHADGQTKERLLFDEYQRSASRLLKKRDNDWELLFDMQHYGIPTRLLDWSDVLGVAIAFALYDSADDGQDSSIHLLDPIKLNAKSGPSEIRRPGNERDFDYKAIYWYGRPFNAVYPIAIDGPLQSDRMVAQQGAFTIHGSDVGFFDTHAADCLRKIIMRPECKDGAREFLSHANLNAYSLYPDMIGMARHIVRKHFA